MRIASNAAGLARRIGRVERELQPSLMRRLSLLPFRDAARGVLLSVLRDFERPMLPAVLSSIAVLRGMPDPGFTITAEAELNPIRRAARSFAELRRLTYAGGRRPKAGGGRREAAQAASPVTVEELQRDITFATDLVELWVTTPFTSREDAASGKDKSPDYAEGLTDEEIVANLLDILGVRPRHRTRNETPDLDAAQASLSRRLFQFGVAQFGEDALQPDVSAERLAEIYRALFAAWRELIEAELPAVGARELARLLRS